MKSQSLLLFFFSKLFSYICVPNQPAPIKAGEIGNEGNIKMNSPNLLSFCFSKLFSYLCVPNQPAPTKAGEIGNEGKSNLLSLYFSKLIFGFNYLTVPFGKHLVGLPAMFGWQAKFQLNKKQADVRRSLFFSICIFLISFISIADSPAQVTISGAASGNGNYPTLFAAFSVINSASQTGLNITLTLTANTSESSTAVLNSGTWASLNIVSSGPQRLVAGNLPGVALVNLNGADNVTIDNVRILNLSNSASPNTCTILLANDARRNTIKNSVLQGEAPDNSAGVVLISGTSGSNGNDSNTFQNNDITNGGSSISAANCVVNSGTGGTSAQKNSANKFTGNRLYGFQRRGFYDIGNSVGTLYEGNDIQSSGISGAPFLVGFEVQAGSIEGFTFRTNFIHNLVPPTSVTVYGMALWQIQNSTTGEVYNNFISLTENNSADLAGIHEGSPSACSYNIYFNSIYLLGSVVSGTLNSDCYYRSAANTSFKNNILQNSRSGGTGKHYAIRVLSPLFAFSSNYNDIYNTGGTGNVFGNSDGIDRNSLALWKTATTKDTNSVSGNPNFISSTNLHISTTVSSPVNNAGISIAGITTDYDGNTRSANPDIGADEFDIPVVVSGAINGNGNYSNLTSAFSAINSFSQTGANIIIQIYSNTTESPAGANLNAGTWTSMTIIPVGARTVSGAASPGFGLIYFGGADKVTIDGLNTGGNSLTIINTTASSTVGTSAIKFINDARRNTVKNCTIMGSGSENTTGVIQFSTATSNGNDSNTIQNNNITKSSSGPAANCISNLGSTTSSAIKNSTNFITGNKLYDFERRGIYDGGGSAANVYDGNEIYTANIQPLSPYLIGFEVQSNTIEGFICRNNNIHDLQMSSSNLIIYGMALWFVQTGFTGDIYNNFISLSDVNSNDLKGIHDGSPVGPTFNIYYNSINISGNVTGLKNSDCYFRSAGTATNLKDNILVNSRTGGTGKHYAIRTVTPLTTFSSNYNDIYNTGGTGNVFGKLDATERTTLALWKSATNRDSNSISAAPLFLSNTNLHIDSSAVSPVSGAGLSITGITTDIDGNTRIFPPDIGADEFNTSAVTVSGANSGNGSYSTLSLAFNAINSASQSGANIQIQIFRDFTELPGGATLNSGLWSSLTITPSGVRTITGAITAGSSLINLNGADRVTIDGLNSGGNSFKITNSTASSTPGTSTINLVNDASRNVITRCTIIGSTLVGMTTSGGVINFGTGSTTGNDSNVVSFCDITGAGSNLPSKGISFIGSTVNNFDTIRNCNVFDYYSTTSNSAGIYAGTGNSDLCFSNNKFYLPVTRAFPPAQHSAIWIENTPGNNFGVHGNTIGYSSSTGTGTYTMTLGSGTRFYPIYLSVGNTAASNVQGNTISAINMIGSAVGTLTNGPFIGILVNSGSVNIGNITGNTIGNMSTTGNISFSSNTLSAVELTGIYSATNVVDTVSNNSIGSITASNSSTGSASFLGIRHLSTGSSVCFNNTIGGTIANSIQSTSSNTGTIMVGIQETGGNSATQGNLVRNMTAANGNATPFATVGIYIGGNGIHSVSQNTIHSLTNTNGNIVSGLYVALFSTGSIVERNFIHSLTSSNSSATIAGIHVTSGVSGFNNNMVRLGINSQGLPVVAGISYIGIYEGGGSNNFYFNSVYIGGTPTSSSSSTFAFRSTSSTGTRNYKNNIFFNARSNSGSTGKHYAISIAGTAPLPAGTSSNFNLIYSSGSGSYLGLYNNIDRSDLTQWKSATGLDSNSGSSNPYFVNPLGDTSNVNLHIAGTSPTFAEAKGLNIPSITNDFDGETRSALSPDDIGADAGNFTLSDPSPMTISYTPVSTDSNRITYNFTGVMINDSDGVETSASLKPRTYFKKRSDPDVFNDNTNSTTGWKYSVANGATSPFDFTLDFTKLNTSLEAGDTLQYFVVAQDMSATPYIYSNAVSFLNYPADVQLTSTAFPVWGTPESYRVIKSPLSGDYTVGLTLFNRVAGTNITFEKTKTKVTKEVSVIEGEGINAKLNNKVMEVEEEVFVPMQNGKGYDGPLGIKRVNNPEITTDALGGVYATITAALNDLKVWGAAGPVRFLLLDNAYTSETLPITINSWSGASPVNTLTIKPSSGVTSEISGSNLTGLIDFNGADYVTIDGSNSDGGTSKDLTLKNNSGSAIKFINDARQNILKNTITKATNIGVQFSSTSGPSGNDSNIIQNNDITGSLSSVLFGINNQGSGSTSDQKNSDIKIIGNKIYNFSSRGIQDAGNSVGILYQSNEFFNTSAQNAVIGLEIGSSSIEGFEFSKNNLHDLMPSSTATIYGVWIQSMAGGSSTALITNNFININSPNQGAYFGIYDQAAVKYDIYYNTVVLSGTRSAGTQTTAAYLRSAGSTVDLRNNILINTITGGTASHYVIRNTGSLATLTSNYNDMLNSGIGTNVFAYDGTANRLDLSAWQTATAKDSNSISSDPLFEDSTNLHIDSTLSSPVSNAGTPIAGITTDIDNNVRSLQAPDIGADEFGPAESSITLNLNMFIEGFYDATSNLQVSDTVKVYLRDSNSPYNSVDSATAVLNDSGKAAMTFSNASTGNYYLQIKHRNALETWSANPVMKTEGAIIQYDFTTAATQAFGDNMKQVDSSPNKFAMFSGDENHDGTIDVGDIVDIYNDVLAGSSGYLVTDINGDDFVDVSDLIIAYNNSLDVISVITP